MKILFKSVKLLIAFTLFALMLTSCEKSDNEKDYGFPVIYIPQATITGLDNSYPIPNGPFGENSNYNSAYKDGILNIALGVVRAGYIADSMPFSVNVEVSQNETDTKVALLEESGISSLKLPTDSYQLPTNVNVEAGTNTGTFYLSVDLKKLALSKQTLIANNKWKLLVLGVKLAKPSKYELSDKNTSVIVIIDLNSEYWDTVDEDAPESEVRTLFPKL